MASAPEAVSEKEQERRRSDNDNNNDLETEVLFAKEVPPEEEVAGGGENEVGQHEKVLCFSTLLRIAFVPSWMMSTWPLSTSPPPKHLPLNLDTQALLSLIKSKFIHYGLNQVGSQWSVISKNKTNEASPRPSRRPHGWSLQNKKKKKTPFALTMSFCWLKSSFFNKNYNL